MEEKLKMVNMRKSERVVSGLHMKTEKGRNMLPREVCKNDHIQPKIHHFNNIFRKSDLGFLVQSR